MMKTKATLFWILLCSLFLIPQDLLGKIYKYSTVEPIQGLETIIDKLKGGDTLIIEPGEYSAPEGITIRSSGEPGKPIIIKAKVKGKVKVNGGWGGIDCRGKNDCHPLLRIQGGYLRIEGLTLLNAKGYAILINQQGHHIQVIDNDIVGAGWDGIKTVCGSRDVDLINNRIVSPKEDGIDIFGTVGAKVLRNEIVSPEAYGMFAKGGARNILFEGNRIFNPQQAGIFIGGLSTHGLMCGDYECTDCQAVNNLVVGAGAHGIFAYGCLNGLIANNTIISANSRSGWGASLGAGQGSSPNTGNKKRGSMNIKIVNNIVTYPKKQAYLEVEQGSTTNLYCDYNLYFGLSKPRFDWDGKGRSWDEFKAIGQETHAILRDPQFKDPAQGDYRLLPQSPARGAGLPLDKMVEKDISSNIRPKMSKPSLGAFE